MTPNKEVPQREQLKGEGWVLRCVLGPERVAEAVELYKSIGQEILVLPAESADLCLWQECKGCPVEEFCKESRAIFTRRWGGT